MPAQPPASRPPWLACLAWPRPQARHRFTVQGLGPVGFGVQEAKLAALSFLCPGLAPWALWALALAPRCFFWGLGRGGSLDWARRSAEVVKERATPQQAQVLSPISMSQALDRSPLHYPLKPGSSIRRPEHAALKQCVLREIARGFMRPKVLDGPSQYAYGDLRLPAVWLTRKSTWCNT